MGIFKKFMLSVIGIIIAVAVAGNVSAEAAKGPNKAADSYAYISLGVTVDSVDQYGIELTSEKYIYISDYLKSTNDQYLAAYSICSPEGISYNKKTNTLTLKNYSGKELNISQMGDDFTIKLVGENHLNSLYVYAFSYGGSLTLSGTGSLELSGGVVDPYGLYSHNGLYIMSEQSDGSQLKDKLTINKGVTLKVKSPDGGYNTQLIALYLTAEDKNGIVLNGVNLSGSYISKSQEQIDKTADLDIGYCIQYEKKGSSAVYYLNYSYVSDEETGDYHDTYNLYEMKKNKPVLKDSFTEFADIKKNGYSPVADHYSYTYIISGASCTISAKASKKTAKNDVFTTGGLNYAVLTTGTKSKNGTVVCIGCDNYDIEEVIIPDTVKYNGITYKVTQIYENAFSYQNFTKLTIGKNVKTIGTEAFSYCDQLKTITINTAKLTSSSVKKDAFSNTSAAPVIKVPSGKLKAYKALLGKKGMSKSAKYK